MHIRIFFLSVAYWLNKNIIDKWEKFLVALNTFSCVERDIQFVIMY